MSVAAMILFFVFFVVAFVACIIDSGVLASYSTPVALVFLVCAVRDAFWPGVFISAGITVIAAVVAYFYLTNPGVRTRRLLEKIITNRPRD